MPASQRSLPADEPGAMAAAEAVKAAGREVASRAPPSSDAPATPSTALVVASLVPAGATRSVAGVDAADGTWATASSATDSELVYDGPSVGAASPVVGGSDEGGAAVLAGSVVAAGVARGGDVPGLEAAAAAAAVVVVGVAITTAVLLPISTPVLVPAA